MEKFAKFFVKQGLSIKHTGEIVKSNGHKATAEEVYDKYCRAQEDAGNEVDLELEQLKEYIKENTPKESAEAKEVFDLRKFIESYIMEYANDDKPDRQKWRIGPAWRTIERLTHGIPTPSDLTELQNSIRACAIDNHLGKSAKMDDIKCILTDMALNANGKRVAAILDKIRYNPESIAAADKAFDDLHDVWKIKQSKEVLKTITRHWMWQVKCKLIGKEPKWAIWPNFFGGTALGKTSLLNEIASPFGDFALTTSISKLLDEERQMVKLTNSYIINLDELSVNNRESLYADKEGQLGRDQQATLKSLLTQVKMQTRLMGGQRQTTRRITFSAISSANEHLADIIYDEKTMRRYFEFVCTVDRITDFTKLEEIKTHVLDMWQSVDENLEDGYWHPGCDVWDEIAKEQSKYYPSNTTTGMWIKDAHVVAGTIDDHEKAMDLYEEYRDYCKERGHICKGYGKWVIDIKHLVEGSMQGDHVYIKIVPEE